MKAIKIASGVAISALAAAISAQAHAESDTEFSWSAVGSMEAMFVYDFEGETKDVDLDEGDDFDSATAGEAWGLEVTQTITHGPFSANIVTTLDDGEGDFAVEDLIVTDGAISFGQVGSLLETDDYAYDMGDSEIIIDEASTADLNDDGDQDDEVDFELDDGAPIDAGIRYTMGGLQVQIEGQEGDAAQNGTDYGVSAAYAGSVDALSYRVDAQFRASDEAPDSADPYTYAGAGVTYTADMFSVKAAYNTYTAPTTIPQAASSQEKETFAEYGFEVEVTPMAALTAYVKGQDLDASSVLVDDSMELLFGAAYTIDMITLTGEYTYTAAEEIGDEILANVTYTDGPLEAYGEVTLANFDAETANAPLFEAGVSYTQDNGVVYAADYDFRAEEADAVDAENAAAINALKLSAAYAF
ncbi:hypothetical protein BGP77_16825 [Saccharospirillum sp. MSK14-1]|uniref:hypothetical protein n=1 Tax=Saccharospirillum sp. MSK14-1 TaxID=1897632 RepID=UPI000D3BCFA2|nr:hypothetical protein [Saccharospirillum sp. MSK14-1]PTY38111.1 hypothetical protein BGP77_16825 [Saccharospirillum sp. MSK14-1]